VRTDVVERGGGSETEERWSVPRATGGLIEKGSEGGADRDARLPKGGVGGREVRARVGGEEVVRGGREGRM